VLPVQTWHVPAQDSLNGHQLSWQPSGYGSVLCGANVSFAITVPEQPSVVLHVLQPTVSVAYDIPIKVNINVANANTRFNFIFFPF
jgi:hypothetical protein